MMLLRKKEMRKMKRGSLVRLRTPNRWRPNNVGSRNVKTEPSPLKQVQGQVQAADQGPKTTTPNRAKPTPQLNLLPLQLPNSTRCHLSS